MAVMDRNRVEKPFFTDHGEVVYELVGRGVEPTTERHSLAQVVLPPGKSSLRHLHPLAEESYYILSGRGLLELGETTFQLTAGQCVLIPPDTAHKISNPGDQDLEFLAVCVPAWEPNNSVWLE